MNKYLKAITELFPTWSKIYKDPVNSVGGKFINAFAKFLLNIDNIINDIVGINFLSTNIVYYEGFQLSKIDFVGKATISKELLATTGEIWIMENNSKKNLVRENTSFKFFFNSDPCYYYDGNEEILYINRLQDVYLDGNRCSVIPHHIWGPYDEIGLLINCPRQPLENNKTYVLRLREAWGDFGNSSPSKLKSFLIRSLIPFSLQTDDKENMIQFVELTDEFVKEQIEKEGLSDTIKSYLEQSRRVNHNFDDSYWDIIENNNLGMKFLPIHWDKSLYTLKESQIQNGVLRKDDLEVFCPELEEHKESISFNLSVKETISDEIPTYNEIPFDYYISRKILGEGLAEQEYGLQVAQSDNIDLEFDLIANLSYRTLSTFCFITNKENSSQMSLQVHVENDKEISKHMDKIIEEDVTENFGRFLVKSDKLIEGELTDEDSLDVRISLSSENNESPFVEKLHLIFDLSEDEISAGIDPVVELSLESMEGNENGAEFNIIYENTTVESGLLGIQDSSFSLKADSVELKRGSLKDLNYTKDAGGHINGLSL